MRRRVDVHRQEPDVQDGVERDSLGAQDQDRRVQERRRYRGGEEVDRDYHPPPVCIIVRTCCFSLPFTPGLSGRFLAHPWTSTARVIEETVCITYP